jgi:hypothetical protein
VRLRRLRPLGLATSPPIGQALAASALDRAAGAPGIVNPELDAVRIAEIELREAPAAH